MAEGQFGVAGLGVMGQMVALNIERNGFPVVAYNRGAENADHMRKISAGKNVQVTQSITEMAALLQKPRKVLIMVTAGAGTDAVIAELKGVLEKGDIIIDGGNAHFPDTNRRQEELSAAGLHFIGCGISGGEKGALLGPSIMPGGDEQAYKLVEPVLTKIAAQTEDGACCTYVGAGSAGHYVKMVHNGIEYGIMQILCEAYDVMRKSLGMSSSEIQKVFAAWSESEISGFLVEISATCLAKADPDTGKALIELILDTAGQKGTGKWTAQTSLDLGVPTPTLSMAVQARILSGLKPQRIAASRVLKGPTAAAAADRDAVVKALFDAVYLGMVTSYAQGLALIQEASKEYNYGVELSEVARIWKAGCIIRSKILDPIKQAYKADAGLVNLMMDKHFSAVVNRTLPALRTVTQVAAATGVPLTCLGASLAYVDSYRSEFLPANLLQAQRDLFGAHTYKRLDREGTFHTEWEEE
ncbi:MAG: NADP-dependent phosphogluconate dehydrogenase [Acidobacteria bacterium]|nr:NADP-dependent phosphogluconate dehydrogenase [Acidobacteriota bacterium]